MRTNANKCEPFQPQFDLFRLRLRFDQLQTLLRLRFSFNSWIFHLLTHFRTDISTSLRSYFDFDSTSKWTLTIGWLFELWPYFLTFMPLSVVLPLLLYYSRISDLHTIVHQVMGPLLMLSSLQEAQFPFMITSLIVYGTRADHSCPIILWYAPYYSISPHSPAYIKYSMYLLSIRERISPIVQSSVPATVRRLHRLRTLSHRFTSYNFVSSRISAVSLRFVFVLRSGVIRTSSTSFDPPLGHQFVTSGLHHSEYSYKCRITSHRLASPSYHFASSPNSFRKVIRTLLLSSNLSKIVSTSISFANRIFAVRLRSNPFKPHPTHFAYHL